MFSFTRTTWPSEVNPTKWLSGVIIQGRRGMKPLTSLTIREAFPAGAMWKMWYKERGVSSFTAAATMTAPSVLTPK
jgi:hypothetical protein